MRHGIEVCGTYEEIRGLMKEVENYLKESMGSLDPDDAGKAEFNYVHNNYRKSYSVEIPVNDEN
jgi:hypothetical protein